VNCTPQFVRLETQRIKPTIINSHIKLINNLIIFDVNKNLLYSPFLKICKKIIPKNNTSAGIKIITMRKHKK